MLHHTKRLPPPRSNEFERLVRALRVGAEDMNRQGSERRSWRRGCSGGLLGWERLTVRVDGRGREEFDDGVEDQSEGGELTDTDR